MDARQVSPVELREGRGIGPRTLDQCPLVAIVNRPTAHPGKCAGVDGSDGAYPAALAVMVGTTTTSGPPTPTTRPSRAMANTL